MLHAVITSSCQSLLELGLQTRSQVKGDAEAGDRGVASQRHRGRNKAGSEAVKEPELHPHGSVIQPRSHAAESPGAMARQQICGRDPGPELDLWVWDPICAC